MYSKLLEPLSSYGKLGQGEVLVLVLEVLVLIGKCLGVDRPRSDTEIMIAGTGPW
jgi:hypothetical protein